MHKSVQLARFMGRGVTRISYTDTNGYHRNNRPVIIYATTGANFTCVDMFANDVVSITRRVINK